MSNHIDHLSPSEKELVRLSPLYVSALIAGADGDFSSDEKQRTFELVHIKTFSEKFGLKDLYSSLDAHVEEDLRKLIAQLPKVQADRNNFLVAKIEALNSVLKNIEFAYSHRLYKSLKEFAHYIANADGGFWSMGSVSKAEEEFLPLDMLSEPQKAE